MEHTRVSSSRAYYLESMMPVTHAVPHKGKHKELYLLISLNRNV